MTTKMGLSPDGRPAHSACSTTASRVGRKPVLAGPARKARVRPETARDFIFLLFIICGAAQFSSWFGAVRLYPYDFFSGKVGKKVLVNANNIGTIRRK